MSVAIRLTGKRMPSDQALALLAEIGWTHIHASFVAQGYKLQPVRAPRHTRDAYVTFRFCWKAPAASVRMAHQWPTR